MRQRQQMKALVKNPCTVFRRCPACESPNLLKFEGDVFCEYCEWNSIDLRTEARISARQYEASLQNPRDSETSLTGVGLARIVA